MQADYTAIIFALFFAVIVVLSTMNSVYVPGRAIYLFRMLFPSWRFFEDLSEMPVLYFRTSADGVDFSDWLPALYRPARELSAVFLNAEANLYLACQSLLQQLETDIGDIEPGKQDEFTESVSYELTKNLVLYRLRQSGELVAGARFQFKVGRVLQGRPETEMETILVSRIEEV